MRETRIMMTMPITIEIADASARHEDIEAVYSFLAYVDETFNPFSKTSEVTAINAGRLSPDLYSKDMKDILRMCEETKRETNGYFDIHQEDGTINPSGLVKGWAIQQSARILASRGYHNYYVEAGGDIQTAGHNSEGQPWSVGIRDPFDTQLNRIVKVLYLNNGGIATSGTYIRGQHIRNPHAPGTPITSIVSMTVIGPNVHDADRFATAAFAMGEEGIHFIESLKGFEGYMINAQGIATMTSGFDQYTQLRAQ